jgi:hypothetical protein
VWYFAAGALRNVMVRELKSWKEIATYLGITVRTAQKWETERYLPVRRPPGGKGPVTATEQALEEWKCTPPKHQADPVCYRLPVAPDVTAEVRFTTSTITSEHITRLLDRLSIIKTTLE